MTRSGPARRATLEEVAKEARVSRATVSRIINGSTSVDAAMVARVNRAVEKLNYIPNQAARSLMTQRTNTVALVVAESDDRVFGDPFFAAIIRGVSAGLSGTGWQLTIVMAHNDNGVDEATRYLLGGHVDGALLISEHGSYHIARTLSQGQVPVVIGGRPLDPTIEVGFVDHNNVAGGELAGRHLHGLGRRRIAHIAGPADMSAGVDRLLGFSRALGDDFDPDLVVHGDFTSSSGAAAMARLLEIAPDVDAVFAASDLMALGALQILTRAGRRIPEDVALVGYDDTTFARDSTPSLTTVRQDTVDQGRRMSELMVSMLRESARSTRSEAPEPSPEGIVLPVRLIVRESA